MNYKFSKEIASRYILLSCFHRGLFWGILLAWISLISAISGAGITQVFYLDQKAIAVAQNNKSDASISSVAAVIPLSKTQSSSTQASIVNLSSSDQTFLLQEYSVREVANFDFLHNYELAKITLWQDEIKINSRRNFLLFNDSIISNFDTVLLTYARRNLKDFKIIIDNQTNNLELANQVYLYLQERDFSNIAIAESLTNNEITEVNSVNVNQTIITTQVKNLEAASYLKSILNFGSLHLVDNQSFEGYSESEIIIHLGEDAQSFFTKQNFLIFEQSK